MPQVSRKLDSESGNVNPVTIEWDKAKIVRKAKDEEGNTDIVKLYRHNVLVYNCFTAKPKDR